MSEQTGGQPKEGRSSIHSEHGSDQARQPDAADGQKMPAPHLTEAVDRVERHELERRLERLSGEMASMRKVLGSLTRFRTVIDRAGEAIFIIDPSTERFVDANETALKWLGLPRDRLLSLSVADVDVQFPLQYLGGDLDHVTDTRSAERPQTFGEGIHRRRDGTSFPVEVAIARRPFAGRDLVLVVARESKPRRKAEQELCESEERYRTLFELTPDAIYLTSRDGTVVEVNAAGARMFGYTRDELVGLQARRLYCDKADIKAFQEGVEENGFVRELPVTLCTKNGSTFQGFLTATLRHSGDGIIGGYQCLIRQVPVADGALERHGESETESENPEESFAEAGSVSDIVAEEMKYPELEQLGTTHDVDEADEHDEGLAEDQASPEESHKGPLASVERERIFHPALEIDVPEPAHPVPRIDDDRPAAGFGVRVGTIRRTRQGVIPRPQPAAPWEPRPETRVPRKIRLQQGGIWLLVLGFGALTSAFGWSGFVATVYPYDSGMQAWQLTVRVWGAILVALGVAGPTWRRTARAAAIALILTAVAAVMMLALYVVDSPFGLQTIVSDSTGTFNPRVLKALEFVAGIVLCTGAMSWYIWRSTRERIPL